jgi:DNA-directed RNA polymerase specialized sigma24 family protein
MSKEQKVMEAFYEGCTYKEISKKCGVSKARAKVIIEKKVPELYDIVKDTKRFKEYRNNNSTM